MNVYEAIKASPIGVAWHEDSGIVTSADGLVAYCAGQHLDGWQPLYTSPAEYTLGEPLTESVMGQMFIRIKKETGEVQSGTFTGGNYPLDPCSLWTYYADPRPLPKLPEKKPRYKVETCYLDSGRYWLITKDGKRYAELFNRANAEEMVKHLNEIEEQKK